MPKDLGNCLACSVNPATTTSGTLPLCASCSAEAKKNARGVRTGPKKPKDVSLN